MLLKEIIDQISQVLVEVFNKSMTQGEFPTIMKLAEVVSPVQGKRALSRDQLLTNIPAHNNF